MTTESPNVPSQTAREPIINVIDPHKAENISWEIRDDLGEEPKDEQKPDEVQKDDTGSDDGSETEPDREDSSSDTNAEVDATDEDEEPEKAKKKPLRAPKDRRISELTRKNKQYQAVLADQLKETEYYKQQLAFKEKEKMAADENLLKTHMENIERAHAEALEEGDYDKAAKAASLMAQYSARHETVAQQRAQINYYPQQQPQYQEPVVPEFNEEFQKNGKDWIEQNQWADSNSINYNPKLLQRAENFVEELMDIYTFEGRAEDIGKPEFFHEITQHVKDSFNVSPPSKNQKEKLVMNANAASNVSPVNRPASVSNVQRSKNDISLSADQIKMAHAMSGIKLNGQRITDKKQLEGLYKQNLMKQMSRG